MASAGRYLGLDGVWRGAAEALQKRAGRVQDSVRLAALREPGFDIADVARIDPSRPPALVVVFIKLHGGRSRQRRQAGSGGPARSFRKKKAHPGHVNEGRRLTGAVEPDQPE